MSKVYKRSLLVVLVIAGCLYLLANAKGNINSIIKSQLLSTLTPITKDSKTTENIVSPPSEALNPPTKGSSDGAAGKLKKDEKKDELFLLDACTVVNPSTHGFIDLRELSSVSNEGKALPWVSKGYDSGHNFTLGICSNPFKKSHQNMKDNVNSTLVGGYYIEQETGKYVSIGEYTETPIFRGRKLTLTYGNGSYCDNFVDSLTGERLRKTSILTFTCDREMLSKATISFVGSANDCSYFFEVRSHHACPTAAKADNLAVIWIFLFIFLVALFVYFSGGLLYKQMKHHRQKKINI